MTTKGMVAGPAIARRRNRSPSISPIMEYIYDRLPDGVLNELRWKNPSVKSGKRRQKHHQWLTGKVGHLKLRDHLIGVLAPMRAAPNWDAFRRAFAWSYTKPKEQWQLALGVDE